MSKRLFVLLVVLMSLSLIGIIFVQAYYINNTVENEEKQFTFNVKKALSYVSSEIEKREFREFALIFQKEINTGKQIDTSNIRELLILSSSLFDIGLDSITIMRIINNRETRVVKNNLLDNPTISPEDLLQYDQITRSREIILETSYKDYAKRKPLRKRTSKNEILKILK